MKFALRDLAKLILACAVASAAVAPAHRVARLRGADLGSVLLIDGIVTSIVLIASAYALNRRGLPRPELVESLVLGGTLCFLLLLLQQDWEALPPHLRAGGIGQLDDRDWTAIGIDLGVTAFAGSLIGRLGRRALVAARRRAAG